MFNLLPALDVALEALREAFLEAVFDAQFACSLPFGDPLREELVGAADLYRLELLSFQQPLGCLKLRPGPSSEDEDDDDDEWRVKSDCDL